MPKESIIKHYSSSTTGSVPSAVDLVAGELAINTADEKVFFKNLGGTVVDISQSKGISGTYARLASSVSSLNGLTGARTLTGDGGAVVGVGNDTIRARLATASLTGVASFPATDFAVSAAGAVTLTGNVAKTNVAQTFTAFQNFTSGLSGNLTGNASTATTWQTGRTITIGNTGKSVNGGGNVSWSLSEIGVPAANNVVNSVNGATGAITNVAVTNAAQSFTGLQTFNGGISAAGITAFNRLVVSTTSATVAPFLISASALNDGVGALRIESTEPDIFLDDTNGGFATITFASAGDARCAFGRNSGNDMYFTVRDPAVAGGAWKDTTMVLDSSSGNVSFGYDVSVAGNLTVKNVVNSIVVGGATLTGNVSLTAGSNITLTPSGSTITIASTASGGVTTSAANTWTATQTFSGGINVSAGATFSGSVESNTGYRIGAGAINAQTTAYTLAAGDNGKVITINSASAVNLTVGTAVGTTGFSCSVIQLGAGQVTIAGSGVTLNSYSGLKIQGQHGAASIVCYATNTFNVAGNLTT